MKFLRPERLIDNNQMGANRIDSDVRGAPKEPPKDRPGSPRITQDRQGHPGKKIRQNFKESGKNLERIWKESGKNLERIWKKSGKNLGVGGEWEMGEEALILFDEGGAAIANCCRSQCS